MRAKLRVLAWEQARQTTPLVLLAMGLLGVYWALLVSNDLYFLRNIFYGSRLFQRAVLWVPVYLTVLFLFCDQPRKGVQVVFPQRLFVLPARTVFIVSTLMAYRVLVALLVVGVTLLVEVETCRKTTDPWTATLTVAAVVALGQALSCLVGAFGYWRGIGIGASLVGILTLCWISLLSVLLHPSLFQAGFPMLRYGSPYLVDPLVTVLLVLFWLCLFGAGVVRMGFLPGALTTIAPPLTVIGSAAAVLALSNRVAFSEYLVCCGVFGASWAVAVGAADAMRHGEHTLREATPLLPFSSFMFPEGGKDFLGSPLGTQAVFEWRNTARYLLWITIPVIGVSFLFLPLFPHDSSALMGVDSMVPFAIACGVGFFLLRASPPYRGFVGVRPLSDRQIGHAKLLAGTWAVLATGIVTAAVLAGVLWLEEVLGKGYSLFDSFVRYPDELIPIFLGLLFLATWAGLMAGRIMMFVLVLGTVVALGAYPLVGDVGLVIGGLVLPVFAALSIFALGVKRGLLPRWALLLTGGLFTAAIASAAVFGLSHEVGEILAGSLAGFPIILAWVPLTVHWQRHR